MTPPPDHELECKDPLFGGPKLINTRPRRNIFLSPMDQPWTLVPDSFFENLDSRSNTYQPKEKLGWREKKKEEDDMEMSEPRKRRMKMKDDRRAESPEPSEEVPSKMRKPLEGLNFESLSLGPMEHSGLEHPKIEEARKPVARRLFPPDQSVLPIHSTSSPSQIHLSPIEDERTHVILNCIIGDKVNPRQTILNIKQECQNMTENEHEEFFRTTFGCSKDVVPVVLSNINQNKMSDADRVLIRRMHNWSQLADSVKKILRMSSKSSPTEHTM